MDVLLMLRLPDHEDQEAEADPEADPEADLEADLEALPLNFLEPKFMLETCPMKLPLKSQKNNSQRDQAKTTTKSEKFLFLEAEDHLDMVLLKWKIQKKPQKSLKSQMDLNLMAEKSTWPLQDLEDREKEDTKEDLREDLKEDREDSKEDLKEDREDREADQEAEKTEIDHHLQNYKKTRPESMLETCPMILPRPHLKKFSQKLEQ